MPILVNNPSLWLLTTTDIALYVVVGLDIVVLRQRLEDDNSRWLSSS